VVLLCNSAVERGQTIRCGIVVGVGGVEPMSVGCRLFAAGLAAPKLARRIDGMPPGLVPKEYFAKGDYFSLVGKAPFSRLVYPVPGGLGIHLTLDMAGQARSARIECVDRCTMKSIRQSRHSSMPGCVGIFLT
jgi:L-2-hydroxyglutarate oxidase LhgO